MCPSLYFWYTDLPYGCVIGRKIWGYGIARKAKSGTHSIKWSGLSTTDFYSLQFGRQSVSSLLLSQCLLLPTSKLPWLTYWCSEGKSPGKTDWKSTHIYCKVPLQCGVARTISFSKHQEVCVYFWHHIYKWGSCLLWYRKKNAFKIYIQLYSFIIFWAAVFL